MSAPLLTCLLPVRNGERDLPGYLESVGRFADSVIALDDGSTDSTRELLNAGELVSAVIVNPPRPTYAGWDDRANRQRLLDAASDQRPRPRWVLYLDVDERIDPADGATLREFLTGADALRTLPYGLELHRMWGDRAEPGWTHVFRLFAPQAGQQLPDRRLHFDPIPSGLGPPVPTTIRVRHLDSPQRLAERTAKYSQADPVGELRPPVDRLLAVPSADLVPWRTRPAGLPALAVHEPSELDESAPLLTCLLPVRNGERDLPGYLESVGRFADSVIALDDGSTDSTRELLAASELVSTVIATSPRPTYAGWDDRANRQRLLDAANDQPVRPRWVLYLDVDERIDPADGAALREFLEHQALDDFAYALRVHRMIGDLDHYDRAGLWVGRLFAPAPEQRLPAERLHLVPIPTSIPSSAWLRTTFRIQHLAEMNEDRRRERVAKYRSADPGGSKRGAYRDLGASPGALLPWPARGHEPPLAGTAPRVQVPSGEEEHPDPMLSAIVVSADDEDRIERCLRSVVNQRCPFPVEVIAVSSGSPGTARIIAQRFPDVSLVTLPNRVTPGAARNAGLALASGRYVSFPGSHVELAPGSLAARVAAHERGFAMVAGTLLNGTATRSGWASFFLDHSASLPGRPSEVLDAPPAKSSYTLGSLLEVGGFPAGIRAGEDTVVNHELWSLGYRGVREQEVRLIHHSRCINPARLLRHHFGRGRSFARILLDEHRAGGAPAPGALRPHLLGYVRRRVALTHGQVRRWGPELEDERVAAAPLIRGAVVAAWLGMWMQLLRPRSGKLRALRVGLARPDQRVPSAGPISVILFDEAQIEKPE